MLRYRGESLDEFKFIFSLTGEREWRFALYSLLEFHGNLANGVPLSSYLSCTHCAVSDVHMAAFLDRKSVV